jgi:23S rRNA (adenine2503-C2)-methyltransferase
MEKENIKDFTFDLLKERLTIMGEEPYRATQIFKRLYKHDVASFSEMTDISKDLRKYLDEQFHLGRSTVEEIQTSEDGTQKLLLRLQDGENIETVLIPGLKNRLTLCISSQVGCALACTFCRTGKGGFVRDLSTGEIVEQVLASARHLEEGRRISNIVIMGMGEPLLNYDNVLGALHIFAHDKGPNYSARKVTLSTVGITPALEQLGKDIEVSLAISLHAADDELRTRLMPINKKYPLAGLIEVCKNYPLGSRRRITFEYLLIKDVNDSDQQARQLAKLVAPLKAKVNLIAFNSFDGGEFEPSSEERIEAFQNILTDKHVFAIVRKSRGQDILAACGQLRAKHQD